MSSAFLHARTRVFPLLWLRWLKTLQVHMALWRLQASTAIDPICSTAAGQLLDSRLQMLPRTVTRFGSLGPFPGAKQSTGR